MKEYVVVEKLMGSAFKLGIVHNDSQFANAWLSEGVTEIRRIENLLSEFLPQSETNRINNFTGGTPLKIDQECFDLIWRSVSISQLSQGDFDVTVAPLKQLYKFKNAFFQMPDQHVIANVLKRVGFNKMHLNKSDNSIQFSESGMKLSFAAIGKGYASDRVKKLWLNAGVTSGYINASGDLNAFGNAANGKPWNIGIANPDDKLKTLLYLRLNNVSIATSGDYEQHFVYEGEIYSHNINPHTGLPLSGIKSVSVISPSAELSDALATAVYVKGVKRGIDFINQLPQTHCIIISENNQLFLSDKISYEVVEK